jgi:regulator of RNase E activity RraA
MATTKTMVDDEFVTQLSRLELLPTAFTTDVLKVAKTGVWSGPIVTFGLNNISIAAPVSLLREVPNDEPQSGDFDNLYEALEAVAKPNLVIIKALGTDYWTMGENTVNFAANQGVKCCFIDGSVRDSLDLRVADIPSAARQVTPTPPSGKRLFRIEQSITLSNGVSVEADSVAHMDADGACFFSASLMAPLLEAVLTVASSEMQQADVIRGGGRSEDVREVISRKNKAISKILQQR